MSYIVYTTFNLNQSLNGVKSLGSINYTLEVENVFTEQFLKTKYYQKKNFQELKLLLLVLDKK